MLKIEIEDEPSAELTPHLDTCCEFISQAIAGKGAVLVNCNMGISRSASVVMAYLIKTQKMAFKDAQKFVKDKRKEVEPNFGFLMQLEEYDEVCNDRQIEF